MIETGRHCIAGPLPGCPDLSVRGEHALLRLTRFRASRFGLEWRLDAIASGRDRVDALTNALRDLREAGYGHRGPGDLDISVTLAGQSIAPQIDGWSLQPHGSDRVRAAAALFVAWPQQHLPDGDDVMVSVRCTIADSAEHRLILPGSAVTDAIRTAVSFPASRSTE